MTDAFKVLWFIVSLVVSIRFYEWVNTLPPFPEFWRVVVLILFVSFWLGWAIVAINWIVVYLVRNWIDKEL